VSFPLAIGRSIELVNQSNWWISPTRSDGSEGDWPGQADGKTDATSSLRVVGYDNRWEFARELLKLGLFQCINLLIVSKFINRNNILYREGIGIRSIRSSCQRRSDRFETGRTRHGGGRQNGPIDSRHNSAWITRRRIEDYDQFGIASKCRQFYGRLYRHL